METKAPESEPDRPSEGTASSPPDGSGFREPIVEPEKTRALVLLYHAFDKGRDPFSVSSVKLDRQLAWMAAHHVEVVALSDFVRFLEGELRLPERVAVITIDDGMPSVYTAAWPVLRRHGARFALGLPTQLMNDPPSTGMLTWGQVREMVDSGLCEVASHSHHHRGIVHHSKAKLAEELSVSRTILKEQTGQEPIAFFYPMGAYNDHVVKDVAAAGYRAAFGASGAPVAVDSCDRYKVPRVGITYPDTVFRFAYYFGPSFLGAPLPHRRRGGS